MDDKVSMVPYVVMESISDRYTKTNLRLWILCVLLIILLVGTNAMWIWYESQFEEVVVTQEGEDGYNNYIGNNGDIYNGETDN